MKTLVQYLLFVLAFICIIPQLFAQQVTFQRSYHFQFNTFIYNIIPTPDSGFIAAGNCDSVQSNFANRSMVFKCDRYGAIQWSCSFRDSITQGVALVWNIYPLSSGYYLLSLMVNNSRYLMKLNQNGQIVWTKRNLNNFSATGFCETPDGHLLLSVFHNNQYMLSKTDSALNPIWTRAWYTNTGLIAAPYDLVSGIDGIFYSVYFTDYIDDFFATVKLDTAGNVQWTNWFSEAPQGIIALPDSSCKLLFSDCLLSLSKTGDTVSNIFYVSLSGEKVKLTDIKSTTDGGFIVGGETDYTSVNYYKRSLKIMKLDSLAHPVWMKKYTDRRGEQFSNSYLFNNIYNSSASGLIIVGHERVSNSAHAYVINTDSSGNTFCNDSLMGISDSLGAFSHFGTSLTHLMYFDSISYGPEEVFISVPLMMYDSLICPGATGMEEKNMESTESMVYPNPCHDVLYFRGENQTGIYEILIADLAGRCMMHSKINFITGINVSQLTPGIYFYDFTDADGIRMRGKFVKN